jgi:hypothetical protein
MNAVKSCPACLGMGIMTGGNMSKSLIYKGKWNSRPLSDKIDPKTYSDPEDKRFCETFFINWCVTCEGSGVVPPDDKKAIENLEQTLSLYAKKINK